MKIKRSESGKAQFDFPAPMYFIAKLAQANPAVSDTLHTLEFARRRKNLEAINVDRPIYVTGLARARALKLTSVSVILSLSKDLVKMYPLRRMKKPTGFPIPEKFFTGRSKSGMTMNQ